MNRCLTAEDIQDIIKQTADPIQDANLYPGMVGAGRINAYKAVSLAQNYHNNNDTITSNETWSTNSYRGGTVVIDSLATLTITGTLYCSSSFRLIVRPGGKFVVDGGTLTSACPGEMWQGIEVVGDRTKKQLAQYQGSVELKNGAVIENALCGIYAGLQGDATYATAGGIISAANSSFHNNRRAVEINSYAFTPPSGGVSNYNAAFTNCAFSVDAGNLFSGNNTAFAEHVRLWDVKGVKFHGCTFANTTSDLIDRGRGIYAEDAGLVLDEQCSPDYIAGPNDCQCPPIYADTCVFSGFTTAVEVSTSGNPYAVEASRVRLSNNGTGIRVNSNDFVTVTRCYFNLEQNPGYNSACIGLRLDDCTGYKVEGNTFERSSYPTGPNLIDNAIGIAVSNSGTSNNSLYRNNFYNLTRGISVSGNNGYIKNGGLQISCNEFIGGKNDIYLNYGATISYIQGSSTKGADNAFSTESYNLYNLYNPNAINITYYYYGSGTNLAPIHNHNVVPTSINVENSCLSTLCNGNGTPMLLSGFQSGMNAYTSAEENVDVMDGGTVETQNLASLQTMRQTLSNTYYAAVREIMSDTVLDLNELEQWHAAAQPIADPYSLTETRFMEGYAEMFTADADDAEMANYADFHALKLALRGVNDGTVGANDYSPLQTDGHINWYALTDGQIAQLQTIAERNTGRASVMAKGVLCFFFGICYDDNPVGLSQCGSPTTGTRAKRTAMDSPDEATLTVYPNPTDDVLFVELRGGASIANIALYDLQGRMVEANNHSPLQGGTATIDMKSIPSGVYVLRVMDGDGKEYHRKIVRK